MRYAISACLAGMNCKYSGGNNYNEELMRYLADNEYICICPEVLGGLPIPRASCEIVNGCVLNTEGKDCTEAFLKGADLAMEQIKDFQANIVILQPRSPSCGAGKIYDGTFSGYLVDGDGVFVKMLKEAGILAITCEDFSTSSRKEP